MFSFQRSLPLVEAALLSYHSASFMSTTFFKLFPKLFVVVCCPSATFNNIPRCFSINQAFFLKREKKKTSILSLKLENGREDRIRTCDPMVPNHVLYQAELLPDFKKYYGAPERSRTPNLLIRSQTLYPIELRAQSISQYPVGIKWSGRRDSNPRPPPWQGDVLPLNYFRK